MARHPCSLGPKALAAATVGNATDETPAPVIDLDASAPADAELAA